ncbi:hypothetical protein [Alicyclobacillus sp. ALC3]|uniref:hypothetical protein n=1 Tax=Alicyclobacillus sp. ALC3 TaxID=2796143 RepID=UPI0023782C49|nr:hypothetical protein [Alicyclobacillus sp. ALC3]WDL98448.1 hypothetical protein JC200_07125 [Alicyclobacillus sp. ALC3]
MMPFLGLLLTGLFLVLFLVLQVFLSRRKSPVYGLVLIVAIAVGLIAYLRWVGIQHHLFSSVVLFVTSGAIYLDGRNRVRSRRDRELAKMTIQDLE